MIVIAHNIRSSANIGSIFRTADGAGIKKIYLTGYSPAPLDRFNRPVKPLIKVALGAERTVPWQKVAQVGPLIARLKKEGYLILALEQHNKSLNLPSTSLTSGQKNKSVLIVGNEVQGLSAAILKKADRIIEIPMLGAKESLNVAVAAGVALYWLNVLQ